MNTILQKRIEEAATFLFKQRGLDKESCRQAMSYILSNQWISVEEALPEDYEDVFVRNEFGKCTSAFLAMGRWHLSYGEIAGDDHIDSKITHWAMIPTINNEEK